MNERQQAVIDMGTSFSGNPYFKLPKLEALTDEDFRGLTADQQDSVRFSIHKLTQRAPGEDQRRAVALRDRFGVWDSRATPAVPVVGTDPTVVRAIKGESLIIPKRVQRLPKAARDSAPTRSTGIRVGGVDADGTVRTEDGKVIGKLVNVADRDTGGWAEVKTDVEPAMRIAGSEPGGITVSAWLGSPVKQPGATPVANLKASHRSALNTIDAAEMGSGQRFLTERGIPRRDFEELSAAGLIEEREENRPGRPKFLHLTDAGHEALKAADSEKYTKRREAAQRTAEREAAQRERAAAAQVKRDEKLAQDLETGRGEGLDEQEIRIGGLDFARQQRAKRASEAEAAQAAAIAFGVPAYEKGQGGYSGPNYQAALATNSKLIKKLQKDHTDDEIRTIAPQYRAYIDAMTALDKARADVASAQRRSEYINTIRQTGEDESYRPSLDASNADVRAAFAVEQDAYRAAGAAHTALEEAAVGLYTAKGRTKKASTLAIPAPERTGPVSDRQTLKERISEALPTTEGAATEQVKAARQAVLARLRTEDQIANEEATVKRHESRAGVIMRYEGGDSPYPSPERTAKREEAAAQRALAGQARGRVRALEDQLKIRREEQRVAFARMEASKPQVVAGVSYADVVKAVDAASTGGRSHRTEEAAWRADIRARLNLPDPGDEPMMADESIEVSRDDIRVGDFIGGERGGLGFQVASVTRNGDGSTLLAGLGVTGAAVRTLKPGEADTVKVWRPGVSDRNRLPLRPEEDDLPLMARRMLQGMDEEDRYAAAERLRASQGLPSRPRGKA